MIFDVGDRITLSDNKVYLVSSVYKCDFLYYLLVDVNDYKNTKVFLLKEKQVLEEIRDPSQIKVLLPYLLKNALNSVKNILESNQ